MFSHNIFLLHIHQPEQHFHGVELSSIYPYSTLGVDILLTFHTSYAGSATKYNLQSLLISI